MTFLILLQQPERIGSPILGVIIPAVILLVACFVTWALYRHFAK
jgi:hypothetical protein